jgi:hypothetical protein
VLLFQQLYDKKKVLVETKGQEKSFSYAKSLDVNFA